MGAHLVAGEFQSDKYPICPAGKVPLSVKDSTAQDLLWEYAQRRRAVDAEFAEDLEVALVTKGFAPPTYAPPARRVDMAAVTEKLFQALMALWHARPNSPTGVTAPVFLGLTEEEYAALVESQHHRPLRAPR